MLSAYAQPFYPFQAEDESTENIPTEKRKVNNIKNLQHTTLNINKQTMTSTVKESTKNEQPTEGKSIKIKNSLPQHNLHKLENKTIMLLWINKG